jgi:hypothetical protein
VTVWEVVHEGVDGVTERMEVDGGYLYRSVWKHPLDRGATFDGSGMVFVPDAVPLMARLDSALRKAQAEDATHVAMAKEPV